MPDLLSRVESRYIEPQLARALPLSKRNARVLEGRNVQHIWNEPARIGVARTRLRASCRRERRTAGRQAVP